MPEDTSPAVAEEHKVAAPPAADVKPTKPDKNNKSTSMHVKVYAPFKVYFDGEAQSISAVNGTGPFDILPQHHNFMTLVSEGDIVVRTDRGEEKIQITRGIMHVKADKVIVFLDV
jgi:F0F1-type ATP synthase epsilon subunit